MRKTDSQLPIDEVPPRPIRWWPAVAILLLSSAVAIYVWFIQDVFRQIRVMQSYGIVAITSALLFLWLLLFSRLPWRRRLLLCVGVLAIVGTLAATLEIRGVTGDLVPLFEWRWTRSTADTLPSEQVASAIIDMPLASSSAGGFPQFGGPSRTGLLPEIQLRKDWDARPPEALWRQPIGSAWSGFAIAGQHAVTMEQRGEKELVTCYQLSTGDLIWTHGDEARYATVVAGEGPRSVPTIADGRVFTMGATGILNCLSLADGEEIWSHNVLSENEASAPEWGFSCSPLVADGKVIVRSRGEGCSLIAYDAELGESIWAAGDDRGGLSYSSPVLTTIDGVDQVLTFNTPGVRSHDLQSGEVLWEHGWKGGHPHIVMPVALPDGRVLVSSGYGHGSELLYVSRESEGDWSAKRVWKSTRLKSKFANVIVHDEYVYGLDDGILVCLELDSGVRQWKRGRYGHGQLLLVGDALLVMAENGDVVMLEPTPVEHRVIGRFAALDNKCWNPPALAGEYLLVRNHKEVACYRLNLAGDE